MTAARRRFRIRCSSSRSGLDLGGERIISCACGLVTETIHDVIEDVAIAEELIRIKAEIERDGGATIGCDELRVLCPDYLTVSQQFMRIASIAQKEGWSFAFLPDGRVRFGSYLATV